MHASIGDARLPDRFWEKVQVNSLTGCWEWTASLKGTGYGQYCVGAQMKYVHRVAYIALASPIPEGMHCDHLCRNRCCVNPGHIEIVTHAENVRRGSAGAVNKARLDAKTHCVRGHPLSGSNLIPHARQRRCRECSNMHTRNRRAAQWLSDETMSVDAAVALVTAEHNAAFAKGTSL